MGKPWTTLDEDYRPPKLNLIFNTFVDNSN
jgi:hypothetical protein